MWYLLVFLSPIIATIVLWTLFLWLFRFLALLNFWLSSITTAWLERGVDRAVDWLERVPSRLRGTFARMRRRARLSASRHIRIFLSSTQADLKLERFLVHFD